VASTAAADLVDPRARVCLLAEDKVVVSDARASGGLPAAIAVVVVVVVVVDDTSLVSPVVVVDTKFFLFVSDLRLFFFSPNTSRMTP
jgi:hypothetical protein